MESKQIPQSFRITFDSAVNSEPVKGLIQGANGNDHEFVGWLELIQKVDEVRGNYKGKDQP